MFFLLQVIADNMFGSGNNLESLAQNYSLILSNSHFSINEVRPLVPTLIEVGGLHLNDAQNMPKVSFNQYTILRYTTNYHKLYNEMLCLSI